MTTKNRHYENKAVKFDVLFWVNQTTLLIKWWTSNYYNARKDNKDDNISAMKDTSFHIHHVTKQQQTATC